MSTLPPLQTPGGKDEPNMVVNMDYWTREPHGIETGSSFTDARYNPFEKNTRP